MKKFSKDQLAAIDTAVTAIAKAEENFTGAIEAFNEGLDELRGDVEQAQADYNEKVAALQEIYTTLAGEAREYYEEKSEKWQEGDAGSAYNEWIDALESVDLEEMEVDLPERLDVPDLPDFEELAPTEP